MIEQLIEFKTAKLAKEKGFIIPTLCYFRYDEKQCKGSLLDWNEDVGFYSRPTQALLAKWLREIHKIEVVAFKNKNGYSFKFDYATRFQISKLSIYTAYETYEEAFEIGLQEGLKLI